MSFDISVSSFRNGENHPFPRQILEDAFAPYVVKRKELGPSSSGIPGLCLSIFCPDEPPGVFPSDLYVDDLPDITGFSVDRPPGTPLFCLALVRVLRQTPSVLYWPGPGCCVADAEVIAQLPESWINPRVPIENQPGIPTVLSKDDGEAAALIDEMVRGG